MSTFQAIIYAAFHGVTEFLPISASAHHIFIPFLFGWQSPDTALLAALQLGALLALLIYFRHDWASMISSLLQVILFRRRPMTLDERLPLFILVSTIPVILASYYFHNSISEVEWTPVLVAAIFAGTGIPLWFFDYLSRKLKAMYDWKWLDASVVGLIQATTLVPGWDQLGGAYLGASFLNYKRESAAKYAYFAIVPILFVKVVSSMKAVSFGTSAPSADLSWLSFGVAFIVALFSGLLAIGGFMKHVQTRGMGQYVIYRWLLAAGVCGAYWFRGHS